MRVASIKLQASMAFRAYSMSFASANIHSEAKLALLFPPTKWPKAIVCGRPPPQRRPRPLLPKQTAASEFNRSEKLLFAVVIRLRAITTVMTSWRNYSEVRRELVSETDGSYYRGVDGNSEFGKCLCLFLLLLLFFLSFLSFPTWYLGAWVSWELYLKDTKRKRRRKERERKTVESYRKL